MYVHKYIYVYMYTYTHTHTHTHTHRLKPRSKRSCFALSSSVARRIRDCAIFGVFPRYFFFFFNFHLLPLSSLSRNVQGIVERLDYFWGILFFRDCQVFGLFLRCVFCFRGLSSVWIISEVFLVCGSISTLL